MKSTVTEKGEGKPRKTKEKDEKSKRNDEKRWDTEKHMDKIMRNDGKIK